MHSTRFSDIHEIPPKAFGPVALLTPEHFRKGFISAAKDGTINFFHATGEAKLGNKWADAVLAWRTTLTLRGLPLPGWIWRVGLLALTLGATWTTHRTLLGRDAGVTLMVGVDTQVFHGFVNCGAQGAITGTIIVNSSRAVLYASGGADFAAAARAEALRTREVLNAAKA